MFFSPIRNRRMRFSLIRSLIIPVILSAVAIGLALLMIRYPADSLQSAIRGLAIWWDVLFPALFPFFVISELLLGFGIVHFIGVWLDPLMRPLFRVPGIGGFVMAMGFASGYPVGAKLTSQLREQNLVTREEGERLVAFTTSADPIFLIGAVAVGFFHHPSLAAILLCAHYGTSIVVGLLMRFHGKRDQPAPAVQSPLSSGGLRLRLTTAFRAMHEARLHDNRPIGQLLYHAVSSSLRLMIVVGGLVVFFSTALELLTRANAMGMLYTAVQSVLEWIHLPPLLSRPIINGLFEVTLGVQSAGAIDESVRLLDKTAIAALILSWGGLSVHAQIASLLNQTDLRYRPFLLARMLHGLLAALCVYVLWGPLQLSTALHEANILAVTGTPYSLSAAEIISISWRAFLLLIVFMTALPICIRITQVILFRMLHGKK